MSPRQRHRPLLAALAAGAFASASWAQSTPPTVATLQEAEGSVLVSNPTGLGAGTKGASLRSGVRVITPAHARAVIRYDDGCVVELKPNQRLVIDPSVPCEARLLQARSTLPQVQVASTGPTGGLAGAALDGSLATYAGYGGAAVFTLVGIERWRREGNGGDNKDQPVSPN